MTENAPMDSRRLLEALSHIAAKLNDVYAEDALYEILSALGIALEVDRTYLFDFDHAGGGNLIASQRAEWVQVGQERQIANPQLQNFDMAEHGFADWNTKMFSGEVIAVRVSELPEPQKMVLGEMQGIRSIAFGPVFADGRLRGALGFDDCTSGRDWRAEEIETLRIACSMVGALCY